jgi:hypothetical protein
VSCACPRHLSSQHHAHCVKVLFVRSTITMIRSRCSLRWLLPHVNTIHTSISSGTFTTGIGRCPSLRSCHFIISRSIGLRFGSQLSTPGECGATTGQSLRTGSAAHCLFRPDVIRQILWPTGHSLTQPDPPHPNKVFAITRVEHITSWAWRNMNSEHKSVCCAHRLQIYSDAG